MKLTKCDYCGELWDRPYVDIFLANPDTGAVVTTYNFCKGCMAEGVTLRIKKEVPPLPPGGPNGATNRN
jgi:hypothetical protein